MKKKTKKPKQRIPVAPPSKRHKTAKDYSRKSAKLVENEEAIIDSDASFENWAKAWKDYP